MKHKMDATGPDEILSKHFNSKKTLFIKDCYSSTQKIKDKPKLNLVTLNYVRGGEFYG